MTKYNINVNLKKQEYIQYIILWIIDIYHDWYENKKRLSFNLDIPGEELFLLNGNGLNKYYDDTIKETIKKLIDELLPTFNRINLDNELGIKLGDILNFNSKSDLKSKLDKIKNNITKIKNALKGKLDGNKDKKTEVSNVNGNNISITTGIKPRIIPIGGSSKAKVPVIDSNDRYYNGVKNDKDDVNIEKFCKLPILMDASIFPCLNYTITDYGNENNNEYHFSIECNGYTNKKLEWIYKQNGNNYKITIKINGNEIFSTHDIDIKYRNKNSVGTASMLLFLNKYYSEIDGITAENYSDIIQNIDYEHVKNYQSNGSSSQTDSSSSSQSDGSSSSQSDGSNSQNVGSGNGDDLNIPESVNDKSYQEICDIYDLYIDGKSTKESEEKLPIKKSTEESHVKESEEESPVKESEEKLIVEESNGQLVKDTYLSDIEKYIKGDDPDNHNSDLYYLVKSYFENCMRIYVEKYLKPKISEPMDIGQGEIQGESLSEQNVPIDTIINKVRRTSDRIRFKPTRYINEINRIFQEKLQEKIQEQKKFKRTNRIGRTINDLEITENFFEKINFNDNNLGILLFKACMDKGIELYSIALSKNKKINLKSNDILSTYTANWLSQKTGDTKFKALQIGGASGYNHYIDMVILKEVFKESEIEISKFMEGIIEVASETIGVISNESVTPKKKTIGDSQTIMDIEEISYIDNNPEKETGTSSQFVTPAKNDGNMYIYSNINEGNVNKFTVKADAKGNKGNADKSTVKADAKGNEGKAENPTVIIENKFFYNGTPSSKKEYSGKKRSIDEVYTPKSNIFKIQSKFIRIDINNEFYKQYGDIAKRLFEGKGGSKKKISEKRKGKRRSKRKLSKKKSNRRSKRKISKKKKKISKKKSNYRRSKRRRSYKK